MIEQVDEILSMIATLNMAAANQNTEAFEELGAPWGFQTDGAVQTVTFMDQLVWSSDQDDREDEELQDFVILEANRWMKTTAKFLDAAAFVALKKDAEEKIEPWRPQVDEEGEPGSGGDGGGSRRRLRS